MHSENTQVTSEKYYTKIIVLLYCIYLKIGEK